MKIKICTNCRISKPATEKHFAFLKGGKNNLQSWCRECCNRNTKKYQHTINGYLKLVYKDIKQRCNNPECKCYKNYGGRGIKNKFKSPDKFVDYIINVLKINPKGLTIDRIDNNGHYEKGNIRFVTRKENNNNKRRENYYAGKTEE